MFPPLWIAYVYALLGEKDPAFEWLEKAYQEKSDLIPYIKALGWADNLRSDPRFKNFLRRVGFPPEV